MIRVNVRGKGNVGRLKTAVFYQVHNMKRFHEFKKRLDNVNKFSKNIVRAVFFDCSFNAGHYPVIALLFCPVKKSTTTASMRFSFWPSAASPNRKLLWHN